MPPRMSQFGLRWYDWIGVLWTVAGVLLAGGVGSSMNTPDWKFVAAAVIAILYIVLAVGCVRADRGQSTGGFINLQGMMSALATLPVALPLECFGHKLDFRNNWQMTLVIAVCSGLVFGLGLGLLGLAEFMWVSTAARR